MLILAHEEKLKALNLNGPIVTEEIHRGVNALFLDLSVTHFFATVNRVHFLSASF